MATAQRIHAGETHAGGAALPLVLLCILTPVALTVAGIRLTPIRVAMLLTIVPLTANLLMGRYGRVTGADVAILGLGAWLFVPMIVHHGGERVAFAGISAIEYVGAWLLGRAFVRGADAFARLIRLHLWSLIVLLPFALIELQTGRIVIPSLVPAPFETLSRHDSASGRMGLERVYAVMEHPILWGLYCSLGIAGLAYVLRSVLWKGAAMGFATFMTFTSLSSAPLIAVGIQGALLVWGWMTKERWRLAITLFAILYVALSILSDRGPIKLTIAYLTFNQGSAYTRIFIFEYGAAAVMNSPLVGVGFNDYPKPHWLTGSVDNFWLVQALRYGLPGVVLTALPFALHLLAMARAPLQDEGDRRMRAAHGITVVALAFVLGTVHVWGNAQAFIFFYLGAGAWMYTGGATPAGRPPEPEPEAVPAGPRYTRFAHGAPPIRHRARAERAGPRPPSPAAPPAFTRAGR
ncbi:MAG: O-antigen ligase family protein [Hasllibacter sp.]